MNSPRLWRRTGDLGALREDEPFSIGVQRPVVDRTRATAFQQLLWADHGQRPAHISMAEVEGEISVGALSSSLEALCRRHDVLRARFVREGDALWMAWSEGPPAADAVVEVDAEGDEAAIAALREAVFRPLARDRAPLARVGLARRNERRAIVAFAAHHLVYDAISLPQLLRQWFELLGGAQEGPASSFFAEAHALSERIPRAAVTDWWRVHLSGVRWPMPVAHDVTPASLEMRQVGAAQLSVEETSGLIELARSHAASLNSTTCLAWALAMTKSLDTPELVTACPVATRSRRQAGVVGPLVDDVLLRIPVSGEESVGEALRRVADEGRQTAARVALSFRGILACLDEVGEVRRVSPSPCPVLYAFSDGDHPQPDPTTRILRSGAWWSTGSLRLRLLPMDRRNPERPYDYFAMAELREGRLGVLLRVQRDRVGDPLGREIAARWERALRLLLENPGSSLREVTARLR